MSVITSERRRSLVDVARLSAYHCKTALTLLLIFNSLPICMDIVLINPVCSSLVDVARLSAYHCKTGLILLLIFNSLHLQANNHTVSINGVRIKDLMHIYVNEQYRYYCKG